MVTFQAVAVLLSNCRGVQYDRIHVYNINCHGYS